MPIPWLNVESVFSSTSSMPGTMNQNEGTHTYDELGFLLKSALNSVSCLLGGFEWAVPDLNR